MTNTPDITPPPELVQQWIGDYYGCPVSGELAGVETAIAARAAQWGYLQIADQELEACCEWLEDQLCMPPKARADAITKLRAARRPGPSLKEKALSALESLQQRTTDPNIIEPLRLALEQLDD